MEYTGEPSVQPSPPPLPPPPSAASGSGRRPRGALILWRLGVPMFAFVVVVWTWALSALFVLGWNVSGPSYTALEEVHPFAEGCTILAVVAWVASFVPLLSREVRWLLILASGGLLVWVPVGSILWVVIRTNALS